METVRTSDFFPSDPSSASASASAASASARRRRHGAVTRARDAGDANDGSSVSTRAMASLERAMGRLTREMAMRSTSRRRCRSRTRSGRSEVWDEEEEDAMTRGCPSTSDASASGWTKRLEVKCARLESTVATLRRALAERREDAVTRDVFTKEIVSLRRRLRERDAERERLIQMSNDLRAALRKKLNVASSPSPSPTPPPSSSPLRETKLESVRAGRIVVASTSSERETESQKMKLKSAMRRAKESRRGSNGSARVRHWGCET